MRRTRRAIAGAGAAAVIGALGVSAAYLAPGASPSKTPVTAAVSASAPASTRVFETSTVYRHHPAIDGRITIIGTRQDPLFGITMSVLAWISGGQLCSGAANLASTTVNEITCVDRPAELSSGGPAVATPYTVEHLTDNLGNQLVIGFTAGDVAMVSLKIRGQEFSAKVVPLSGEPLTGAYALWVHPLYVGTGTDYGVTEQDFSQITGYDSRGQIVAHRLP